MPWVSAAARQAAHCGMGCAARVGRCSPGGAIMARLNSGHRVSDEDGARIARIREREGLSWATLGERFGISAMAAKAAGDRVGKPQIPRGWKSAAARLAMPVERYAEKRQAGLGHCSHCRAWFDEVGGVYDVDRRTCHKCRNESQRARAKAKAAAQPEVVIALAASAKEKRLRRAEAHQIRKDAAVLAAMASGVRATATALAGRCGESHVTVGDRLRRLESAGRVVKVYGGWMRNTAGLPHASVNPVQNET